MSSGTSQSHRDLYAGSKMAVKSIEFLSTENYTSFCIYHGLWVHCKGFWGQKIIPAFVCTMVWALSAMVFKDKKLYQLCMYHGLSPQCNGFWVQKIIPASVYTMVWGCPKLIKVLSLMKLHGPMQNTLTFVKMLGMRHLVVKVEILKRGKFLPSFFLWRNNFIQRTFFKETELTHKIY